ncbi:MAG: hypothetical protein NC182_04165 [Prevotella sp.]|nr:hypothetical protein [Staphylococcus sp.]MCM1350376.1 hypothetical protein [Prevotella sp.]
MELLVILIIIFIVAYLSAVSILKKGNISGLLISTIIAVYIILLTIVNVPTLILPPEEHKFKIIEYMYNLYNRSPIVYTVFFNVLVNLFIPLLYRLLVNKTINRRHVCNEFNNFCKDANELIILGGDLDFLLDEKYSEQKKKINNLGTKCTILCNDIKKPEGFTFNSTKDKDIKYSELIDLYKGLYSSGVKIKCFPNHVDLKYNCLKTMLGQIKHTATTSSVKIVSKVNDKFENIDINSIDLIKLLENNVLELHRISKNPVIKCIVIDIGQVAFKKNIENFYQNVAKALGITKDKLKCKSIDLNKKLALGEADILNVLEQKLKRIFTESEKNKIIDFWNNKWEPYEEVLKIARRLRDLGYDIAFMSSIETSNNYIVEELKEYIEKFVNDANYFFLKQEDLSKYNNNQFKCFEERYSYSSFQVLLIDDENNNIDRAKSSGWDTINFNNESMNAKVLIEELKKRSLWHN